MIPSGWIDENGEPTEMATASFQDAGAGVLSTVVGRYVAEPGGQARCRLRGLRLWRAPTKPESPLARYRGVDAHACDDESAERLWAYSEALLKGA